MRDETKSSFAIVRYNARTYEAGGVAAVVKGRDIAEETLKQIERCQESSDHNAGWRYFLEKTDLKPGMDPQEATNVRQARFDLRDTQG
jgi:hypothetical protein